MALGRVIKPKMVREDGMKKWQVEDCPYDCKQKAADSATICPWYGVLQTPSELVELCALDDNLG